MLLQVEGSLHTHDTHTRLESFMVVPYGFIARTFAPRVNVKHLYDLRRKTRQGLRHYAFIDYTYEPTGTSRYGNAVPYT